MSVDSVPIDVGNVVALSDVVSSVVAPSAGVPSASTNQPVENIEHPSRHTYPPGGLDNHHKIIHAREQDIEEEEDNYDNKRVNLNAHGAYDNQGFDHPPSAAPPAGDLHDINAYSHGTHQANEQTLQNVSNINLDSEPVYLIADTPQGVAAGQGKQ